MPTELQLGSGDPAAATVDAVVNAVLDAYANDDRKRSLGQDVGRTRRADGGATD